MNAKSGEAEGVKAHKAPDIRHHPGKERLREGETSGFT